MTVSAENLGINPPAEARITTMFNNIGTGVMVGGALPFAVQIFDAVMKHPPRFDEAARNKWSIIFGVSGAAIGAVFGEIEGRRLQEYRHKVSERIANQENRLAQLETRSQNWATREYTQVKTAELTKITR